MKMPSGDDIDTAVLWLRSNDGDNGEKERCERVAAWLDYMDSERYIKSAARTAGVPPAMIRRKLAEKAFR